MLFSIQSNKYDGGVNRSWECELIDAKESLYILKGTFKKKINHEYIGVIRPNTISIEYFWRDKWFNVFKFISPNGKLLGFYCNISKPPHIFNSALSFVDLDLDIFVDKNFNIKVLDEDEFRENSHKYSYPQSVIIKAKETINELISMIENREFPFNQIS